jgi:hypothetical protein
MSANFIPVVQGRNNVQNQFVVMAYKSLHAHFKTSHTT